MSRKVCDCAKVVQKSIISSIASYIRLVIMITKFTLYTLKNFPSDDGDIECIHKGNFGRKKYFF